MVTYEDAEPEVLSCDVYDVMAEVLATADKDVAMAMRAIYLNNRSYVEVAKQLGISRQRLRSRLQPLLLRMRARMSASAK